MLHNRANAGSGHIGRIFAEQRRDIYCAGKMSRRNPRLASSSSSLLPLLPCREQALGSPGNATASVIVTGSGNASANVKAAEGPADVSKTIDLQLEAIKTYAEAQNSKAASLSTGQSDSKFQSVRGKGNATAGVVKAAEGGADSNTSSAASDKAADDTKEGNWVPAMVQVTGSEDNVTAVFKAAKGDSGLATLRLNVGDAVNVELGDATADAHKEVNVSFDDPLILLIPDMLNLTIHNCECFVLT